MLNKEENNILIVPHQVKFKENREQRKELIGAVLSTGVDVCVHFSTIPFIKIMLCS
jgi:hypothetical protein